MSTVKLTMFEVLEKFLMDKDRKSKFMVLKHDDAVRDEYLSKSRDDPSAIVDLGPSDQKRFDAAEKRADEAARSIATQQVGGEVEGSKATEAMVTQMYRKAAMTEQLQQTLKGKVGQEGEGPKGSKPGQ